MSKKSVLRTLNDIDQKNRLERSRYTQNKSINQQLSDNELNNQINNENKLNMLINAREVKREERKEDIIQTIGSVRQSIYQNEDHTYFSLNLVNNTNELLPAIFETQLTQALINKPSEYHIAVVSFSVSGNAIPLFIFNSNFYGITLSYEGINFPSYVNLISYSSLFPNAVFNYQAFADMVNSALASSFSALQAYNISPGFSVSIPDITAVPYITYDPVTFLFTLVATGNIYAYTGSPNNTNFVQIWFNNTLSSLFSGFESYFSQFGTVNYMVTPPTATNSKDSLILVKDNLDFNYEPTPQVFLMRQTYASLYRWNDILKIALTTNTLGAKTQVIQGNNSDGVPVYYPILASFIPEIISGVDAKGYIQFTPQFLTYVDLTSDTPLRSFDFQFGYITKELVLKQILLLPNESATLLLLFKHKTILQ